MKRILIIISALTIIISCAGNKGGKAKAVISDEVAKADLTCLHFSKIDTSLIWRYKFETNLKMKDLEKFFGIIGIHFEKKNNTEIGLKIQSITIPYNELGYDGSPMLRNSDFYCNFIVEKVKGGFVVTARNMGFVKNSSRGITTTLLDFAWHEDTPDTWVPIFPMSYAPLIEDFFKFAIFDFDTIKSELSTYE